MRRATFVILPGLIIALVAGTWAVPNAGAAHSPAHQLPQPVVFHEDKGRGILLKAWINGHGPYTFALDTGAGLTVISENIAQQAAIKRNPGRTIVAGLSGTEISLSRGVVDRIALGWSANLLPGRVSVAIAPALASGVDGILDPSDAYSPLGFSINLPERVISAFDPKIESLSRRQLPREGAIVPWLRDGQTKRPFVRLSDGRKALIDTGSDFGLAVSSAMTRHERDRRHVRDIGGGAIRATRISPSNVRIGALALDGVPTDLLDGVEKGAPVLLGRDALYPFRLSFDPLALLVEIVPAEN